MITKIAEDLKKKREKEKYEGYSNLSVNKNSNKQDNKNNVNRHHKNNRKNNRHNNNQNNGYNRNQNNGYNRNQNNGYNRNQNNRYNQNHNPPRKDDKNGWVSNNVPGLLGGAALIGGAGLAMKGDFGDVGKYALQSKNRAFKGMENYMKKNSKGKFRIVSNVLSKAVRNYKKQPKTKIQTATKESTKRFNDILQRKKSVDTNFIKNKSAQEFSLAKTQNEFERSLAKRENRVPKLLPEDPNYYMNKNRREFIESGYPGNQKKTNTPKNSKNNRGNLKSLIGSSVIEGVGFAGGVAAIHSIERSLEKKNDEKKNRERREKVFNSTYQIPF